MLGRKAEISEYLCGFAFLFGGITGCLTCEFCSNAARSNLISVLLLQQPNNASGISFAAELLIAVFALLLSLAAFGTILIPALVSLLGYCFGITLFLSVCSEIPVLFNDYQLLFFIPDMFILLRIASLCTAMSLHITKAWTSSGRIIFDMNGRMRVIWIELILLPMLFAIRNLLF